jgi:hypothetical protein
MANTDSTYRGTVDLKQAAEGISDLATLQMRLQEIVSNLRWVHNGGARLVEPITNGVLVLEANEWVCPVPGVLAFEHTRATALRALGLRPV